MPVHRALAVVAGAAIALAAAPAAPAAVDCYAAGAPVCVRAAAQGSRAISGAVRPKRIDSILYTTPVVRITWSSWTRTRAVGKGFLVRCGGCAAVDAVAPVRIVLTRPVTYYCGPSEDELVPIGTWFTRATLTSKPLKGTRRIVDDGHPLAC